MREEGTTTEEEMRFSTRESFEAIQQLLVNEFGPKLIHELGVVDGDLGRKRRSSSQWLFD